MKTIPERLKPGLFCCGYARLKRLRKKVDSQNGPADFEGRYFRLRRGVKSLEDPMAGVSASCCGVNLAVQHWGWVWLLVFCSRQGTDFSAGCNLVLRYKTKARAARFPGSQERDPGHPDLFWGRGQGYPEKNGKTALRAFPGLKCETRGSRICLGLRGVTFGRGRHGVRRRFRRRLCGLRLRGRAGRRWLRHGRGRLHHSARRWRRG